MTKEKQPPEEVKKVVADLQKQIRELQTKAHVYLQGVAQGMGIPRNWRFDENRMAFVQPEKKDKSANATAK